MIFQCLDFKRETPFFRKDNFVYFVFFFFLSTGRKKIGEGTWTDSVPITGLGRDAAWDLAEHFNTSEFLIPHFETFPMLRWASMAFQQVPITLPTVQCQQGCASGDGVLEYPHQFLGKSWGIFWVCFIFLIFFYNQGVQDWDVQAWAAQPPQDNLGKMVLGKRAPRFLYSYFKVPAFTSAQHCNVRGEGRAPWVGSEPNQLCWKDSITSSMPWWQRPPWTHCWAPHHDGHF